MDKKALKIYLTFLFALILGISVDYLFYGKPVGISFFVFIFFLIAFSLILAKNLGQTLKKNQILLLIPIILLSAGVFLRSSSFLVFFNIVGTLYLVFLFLGLFSEKSFLEFHFLKYLVFPLSFLKKSFQKASSFIEKSLESIQTKRKLGSPEFQSIVKGVLLSLPILAIFIWLFALADIVFQRYLDKLLKVSIEPEIVLRILIVLVSSYLFVGVFAKIFNARKLETSYLKNKGSKILGNIESSIILGSVSLLFLCFIIIQFVYLFGGKTYVWVIPEYITYSEYAKKGFGELIAVSVISFLLIYGIDKWGRKENAIQKKTFTPLEITEARKKHKENKSLTGFKILSAILIFELFIIMASAFKRLSLYVDGYGFTFSRLLSFFFLFWLFFTFLLLLYKIFSEKKETLFLYSLFWLTILFLIGMNIFNPDAFIAKKNIERYVQGKQLDIWYFNQLSNDAIPEIVKIFGMEIDNEIKTDTAMNLNYRYQAYPYPIFPITGEEIIPFDKKLEEIKNAQKWQSFNLSKNKALDILLKNSKEIEKYQKDFPKIKPER